MNHRRPGESQDPLPQVDVVARAGSISSSNTKSCGFGSWLSPGRRRRCWSRLRQS